MMNELIDCPYSVIGITNGKSTIESLEPSENRRERTATRGMDLKVFLRDFHCGQVACFS